MVLQQYKNAGNLLYGKKTGDILYSFAEELCVEAFDNAISPEITIILTTAMSPYNRFSGWYNETSHTIELVRQHCKSGNGGIVPRSKREILATLAHEFCHVYQMQVLGGVTGGRGLHRCKSWYESITVAAPFVCGVDIEGLCRPLKSVRVGGLVRKEKNKDSLSEVELTHFPESIIELAKNKDKRLKGRIVGKSALDKIKQYS